MLDFSPVHEMRVRDLTYSFTVDAPSAVELGSRAIQRAQQFFDGASFTLVSIRARPLVVEVDGQVRLYEADVEARAT